MLYTSRHLYLKITICSKADSLTSVIHSRWMDHDQVSGRFSSGLGNIECDEPADFTVSVCSNHTRVVIPSDSGFGKS